MNETQRRIVELIDKNSTITITAIMKELQMSDSGVRKNIDKLKEMGILERQGSNKKGKYCGEKCELMRD